MLALCMPPISAWLEACWLYVAHTSIMDHQCSPDVWISTVLTDTDSGMHDHMICNVHPPVVPAAFIAVWPATGYRVGPSALQVQAFVLIHRATLTVNLITSPLAVLTETSLPLPLKLTKVFVIENRFLLMDVDIFFLFRRLDIGKSLGLACMAAGSGVLLTFVFPAVGCVLSLLMFSSSLVAVLQVRRQKRLGELNPIPYTGILAQCTGQVIYGAVIRNWFVFWANAPGLLMGVWLSLSTLPYAAPKVCGHIPSGPARVPLYAVLYRSCCRACVYPWCTSSSC